MKRKRPEETAMANHRFRSCSIAGLSLLFIFGCVTINIYFPAEKVDSVAGEIVDEVRGEKPAPPEDSSLNLHHFFREIIHLLSTPGAFAEDVVSVSNPTIRSLKASMKARFTQLKPYFSQGVLEEGDDGYLRLKEDKGLGLKEKRDLKSLVAAENQDRKRLYAEVARALQIDPSQTGKVAEIFADKWKESVP